MRGLGGFFGLRRVGSGRKEQSASEQNEGERSAGDNYARGGRRDLGSPDACASMAPSDPRIIA